MISVIVPVYYVTPYLRQCVNSIINQTYADLEILLIDDGSPDQCGEICDEYEKQDNRVRVFHTENRGLSSARNLGIRESSGDYIAFIDSDDWIESEMYEVLLETLMTTSADISVCGYDVVSDRKAEEWRPRKKVYDSTDALKALLSEEINNNAWNKLFRREVVQEVSDNGAVFPEGKNYEDITVMHRIVAEARSVAVIEKTLYHYRLRHDSISQSYTAKNLLDYADAYLTRYEYYRNEKPELSSEELEEVAMIAAKGISKVWRWWYGCNAEEKRLYTEKIDTLSHFSRDHFPLFGYPSWPKYLRLSAPVMRSSSNEAFVMLYFLNQLYRKLWPEKGNTV